MAGLDCWEGEHGMGGRAGAGGRFLMRIVTAYVFNHLNVLLRNNKYKEQTNKMHVLRGCLERKESTGLLSRSAAPQVIGRKGLQFPEVCLVGGVGAGRGKTGVRAVQVPAETHLLCGGQGRETHWQLSNTAKVRVS